MGNLKRDCPFRVEYINWGLWGEFYAVGRGDSPVRGNVCEADKRVPEFGEFCSRRGIRCKLTAGASPRPTCTRLISCVGAIHESPARLDVILRNNRRCVPQNYIKIYGRAWKPAPTTGRRDADPYNGAPSRRPLRSHFSLPVPLHPPQTPIC